MKSFVSWLVLALTLGATPLLACSDATSAEDTSDAGALVDGGAGNGNDPDASDDGDAGTGDAASDDASGGDTAPQLTFTTPPVADLAAGVKFATVAYGDDPRQVMDVFLPASTAPTAAVFYFHGGGFVSGSRTSAYSGSASALRRVTDDGVAFVSVDYRLLRAPGVETEGVLKSLRDCQRSLQFVRRWAPTFNVDPVRIAVYGASAGAGTSLWLAYHDDMAIADSPDPIARQSTRPRAAAAISTQSTYDVMRWAPDVFADTYPSVTNASLLSSVVLRAMLVQFYGLPAELAVDATTLQNHLNTGPLRAYRADVDMLAWMSSDDPHVYVQNDGANDAPNSDDFDLLHHPLHAMALRSRATATGATLEAKVPAFSVDSSSTAMAYLLARLAP